MRWLPEPAPPRLAFQFAADRRRMRRAGWLLWAVAAAFAVDVGASYMKTRDALSLRTEELTAAHGAVPAAPERKDYKPKDVEREVSFARTTVHRIALPWADLFRALSASAVDGVVLAGIQPDAESGLVRVQAEADNMPAMLTYVARLEANPYFRNVALVRHEIRPDQPRRPVAFLVAAGWNSKR
jgi:hypothetical protein